jgi:hypothetical protein
MSADGTHTPLRLGESDPASFGISTTDYVAALPKRRWGHEAKGRALYMPRTGMVLVPSEMRSGGWWACVVMIGDDTYRPDGYSLAVGDDEIETAIDVTDLLRAALAGACLEDFADQVRREPSGRFRRLLDRRVTP